MLVADLRGDLGLTRHTRGAFGVDGTERGLQREALSVRAPLDEIHRAHRASAELLQELRHQVEARSRELKLSLAPERGTSAAPQPARAIRTGDVIGARYLVASAAANAIESQWSKRRRVSPNMQRTYCASPIG